MTFRNSHFQPPSGFVASKTWLCALRQLKSQTYRTSFGNWRPGTICRGSRWPRSHSFRVLIELTCTKNSISSCLKPFMGITPMKKKAITLRATTRARMTMLTCQRSFGHAWRSCSVLPSTSAFIRVKRHQQKPHKHERPWYCNGRTHAQCARPPAHVNGIVLTNYLVVSWAFRNYNKVDK